MQAWRGKVLAYVPGLVLVGLLGVAALLAAKVEALTRHGFGTLTLAIVFGVLLGNLAPRLGAGRFAGGVGFAQKRLLRIGVALYGFNLSLQQIAQLGRGGIVVDLLMVTSTLLVGWFVGRHVLRMDRDTTMLTTVGSAICGAAAVVATIPVLAQEDDSSVRDKATAAVATVVLFGSLAMLVYPMLYAWMGGSSARFGLYVGSTVHEVAQVVAIGSTLGEAGAHAAVVAKMLRVMLLVPFLLTASAIFRRGAGTAAPISVPWFAVMFVASAGLNSTGILPEVATTFLRQAGVLLLTAAMAALGLTTTLAKVRAAGIRPFLLGLFLFAYLIGIGQIVNRLAG